MGKKRKLLFIAGLFIILLISAGCSSKAANRLWLKSPGWSRAVHLGSTNAVAPPPVVIEDDGSVYTVLFPDSEEKEGISSSQLILLTPEGQVQEKVNLGIGVNNPKDPLLSRIEGKLTLFWIDGYQLYAVELNDAGELSGNVVQLSGEVRVGSYDIASNDQGELTVWYTGTRESPGLYLLEFASSGTEKRLIDRRGVRINLVKDSQGDLHAAWAHYPWGYGELAWYYAHYPNAEYQANQAVSIFSRGISNAVRVEGPVMSLDNERVYLFWSETIVSGLDAGNRTALMQSFPVGQPELASEPGAINVPRTDKLDQNSPDSEGFTAGPRVDLGSSSFFPTNSLSDLFPAQGQGPETVLAFRSETEYMWRESKNQVNIVYLKDGSPTSFQPLSFTSTVSYKPSITADDPGNLYLLWLEKKEFSNEVFLTTTDPDKMAYLNKVTWNDYLSLAAEAGFGILAGIVLAPFAAAVWGGISMLGLLINTITSKFRNSTVRTFGQLLSLGASLVIYWFLKLATLPGIGEGYVPFSAWIPVISPAWEAPLQIGVPILIGVLGIFTAWNFTYRKESSSPVYFLMVYAGMDALLSTAVYGILIYGAF
ncbi:MAG: hypothetical protein U5K99_08250 [Anaerolineales bacterium]|nr:hypothetical protein [Anaerolineales bacterium]